jgi:vacuolar protein sorting-associated protein 51
MEKETEIIRDTQTLHSDMQTLVYENYNKFISATDTIKQVNHFLDLMFLQLCQITKTAVSDEM